MKTTLLAFAVLQIRHGEESPIVENSTGKLKGNTVFPDIRIRLGLVPLELKLAPAHDSLIPCYRKPGRAGRIYQPVNLFSSAIAAPSVPSFYPPPGRFVALAKEGRPFMGAMAIEDIPGQKLTVP